jgi:hypothetical protein
MCPETLRSHQIANIAKKRMPGVKTTATTAADATTCSQTTGRRPKTISNSVICQPVVERIDIARARRAGPVVVTGGWACQAAAGGVRLQFNCAARPPPCRPRAALSPGGSHLPVSPPPLYS